MRLRLDSSLSPFRLVVFALALGVIGAPRAWAGDGTLEINQTCAVQTGCFAGDAPGYPVTIAATGSYRLTSNLTVAAPNVDAIDINGVRVRLDLGGFEVAGPGSCTGSGTTLVCSGGGNAFGVLGLGSGARVRNGSVRGFGIAGVSLNAGQGESLQIEQNGGPGFQGNGAVDVFADRNGGNGISLSEGVARGCVATGNALHGIVGFASTVSESIASRNGKAGFSLQQSSVVSDSVARTNAEQGILATGGVVRNNAVELNSADGIVGNNGTLIVGNTSQTNAQAGIVALSTGSVLDNVVRSNTGVSVYLFPEAGGPAAVYRGNVVTGATTVVNGINLGNNSCNGAATCP